MRQRIAPRLRISTSSRCAPSRAHWPALRIGATQQRSRSAARATVTSHSAPTVLRPVRLAGQQGGLLLCVSGLLALTLLLAVGCTAVSDTGGSGGTGGATSPRPTITPPPQHTPIPFPPSGGGQLLAGAPGIKPHLGGVPAFTTDDMANFVKTTPLPQNFGGGDQPTIVTNAFLTGGDLRALLGTAAGRPDAAPVGYVLLKGHFAFLGAGPNNPPASFPYAFVLFDAQTGNLLLYGGLNQPPAPKPTPTGPTPTLIPQPVVKFAITPTSAMQSCDGTLGQLPTLAVTLDNSGSTVAVSWQATVVDAVPSTKEPWAGISPASGTLAAGQTATLGVTPAKDLCTHISTDFTGRVNVQLISGGSGIFTFTDTVHPYIIG
jgi:hypothetical protein